jgi:L-asparaginase
MASESTDASAPSQTAEPSQVLHAPGAGGQRIVLLGTGGTIAGAAASATDNVGYASAQRGVQALVAAVPALAAWPLEAEQVAQVDSKDMGPAVWGVLLARLQAHLARPEVRGVVITHGTDTLEETAWLLHRFLPPALQVKPVVLTAAMRPATSLQADGPQNLLDAVTVAAEPGACGVLAAMAGRVWVGAEVRKVHSYRLEAFDAGDAGPLGQVVEGRLQRFRPWPAHEEHGPGAHAGVMTPLPPLPPLPSLQSRPEAAWPWVEIVSSHAGAGPRAVQALVSAGVQGLVVACTGNGSVHQDLERALVQAAAQGVAVLRATRCAAGGIVAGGSAVLPSGGGLTPAQARVELLLRLLQPRGDH